MRSLHTYSRSRLFQKFMLSYVAILVIPLLIIGAVLQHMAHVIRSNAIDSNQKLLVQAKNIGDDRISSLALLAENIRSDPSFVQLFQRSTPIAAADTYSVLDAINRLRMYSVSSGYILNYYLIFPKIDLVLSPTGNYSLSSFYGYVYQYDKMDSDQWRQEFVTKYHDNVFYSETTVHIGGTDRRAITYADTVSTGSQLDPTCTIIAEVEKGDFLQPLSTLGGTDGGNILVLDAKSGVMASLRSVTGQDALLGNMQRKTSGYFYRIARSQRMLVSYVRSSLNGWTYVVESRESNVLSQVNSIQMLIGVAVALCLVLGVVAAYFLSYRNAQPVSEIVSILKSQAGLLPADSPVGYASVRSGFMRLLRSDMALRQKIEKHIPLAKAEFLRRLMEGELISDEEIHSNMDQVGLDIRGQAFAVAIIQIRGYYGQYDSDTLKYLNAVKIQLHNWFSENNGTKIHAFPVDISENMVAIIAACQDGETAQVDLTAFLHEIRLPRIEVVGRITVGNFCSRLGDIYYSYSQARTASEHPGAESDGGIIHWYSRTEESSGYYYYPTNLEQRLLNMMHEGNTSEADRILDTVYRDNFLSRTLSPEMSANLMGEVRGTMLKQLSQLMPAAGEEARAVTECFKRMDFCRDKKEAFTILHEVCRKLCQIARDSRSDRYSQMCGEVLQFLQKNYDNVQMSLNMMADRFKMTDTNFSHFFKNQIGENFSDYLEKMRIDATCELLRDGKDSFDTIAQKAGYNSSASFRRAFKRCKGLTPSEYRHMDTSA